MDIPKMKPLKVSRSELDSPQESNKRQRKHISRNEVPKYMWQEKAPTKPVEPKESPMCVASVAELFLPDDLKLNSPKKEDREPPKANVRNLASPTDSEDVDNCSDQFSGLFKLEGIALMHALQKERTEDYVRYRHGFLHPKVPRLMMRLYDHVLKQGGTSDYSDSDIYGADSPFDVNTELPKWYPEIDEENGLSRWQRLSLARDFDVWQWYNIASEDFSMLDTLVWMGVQMQKLFEEGC